MPTNPADLYRQVLLNGATDQVSNRSLVLCFSDVATPGCSLWSTDQTVWLWAVNDARAEGTRIVTASQSVVQRNCDPTKPLTCYDGAIVRNVEVTVYDNDQPDILVTQLDPTDPTHTRTDTGSLVLEGWGTAVSGTSGTRSRRRRTTTRSSWRARRPGSRRTTRS